MTRTARDILNQGEPGKLLSALQAVYIGSLLSLIPRTLGKATVTAHKIVLPDNAKASRVQAAYSRVGTVKGRFTPVAGAPASTTEVGISPTGDIFFLAADAVTEAEVTYTPFEGEVFEEVIDVASNAGTPLGGRRAQCLISATSLAGTGTPGALTVMERQDNVGSVGEAALTDTGTFVFNATDAWTKVRVKYVALPGVGNTKSPISTLLLTEQAAL